MHACTPVIPAFKGLEFKVSPDYKRDPVSKKDLKKEVRIAVVFRDGGGEERAFQSVVKVLCFLLFYFFLGGSGV
jgi:hypothetical protein